MSMTMGEEIKRWAARRKSALVVEIIQGRQTVAEAGHAFYLPPSEIESWIADGKRRLEKCAAGHARGGALAPAGASQRYSSRFSRHRKQRRGDSVACGSFGRGVLPPRVLLDRS